MTRRLAVVTTHPIQYQAPLFRLLTERGEVDPEVLFLTDFGLSAEVDPDFGKAVDFDVPLLEGYHHHFVPNRSPRPSMFDFFGAVNPGLVRALAEGDYDAVLVYGYAQASCWIAYATAIGTGLPVLLRGESLDPPLEVRSSARWRFKRAVLGALVARSAKCLAIGLGNARFYAMLGARPEQLAWAPYSVDDRAFREGGARGASMRRALLESVGLDPDRLTVGFAGKLIPRKRVFDVLDAVQELSGSAQLVIIGDGEQRPEVEARIAAGGHAALVGFLNQTDLATWYGAFDVFVLPSDYETWGLVVNEAMAAGCVPVVSDLVGCGPDLVSAGAGRMFRAGDVGDLAAALAELVDEHARDDARERVRARIERYSLLETAIGIEQAVADVAGGHRGGMPSALR